MSKKLPHLGGVAEMLLIPLYYRAVESRRSDKLLNDKKAAAIVEALDYDFSKLRPNNEDQVTITMRAREFDRITRAFLSAHPDGAVVDIGCGLDTRFYRVDNGQVNWHNLDLPQVIALRQDLLQEPACERLHTIAGSALDFAWLEALRSSHPRACLFLAEGVLPYFQATDVRRLILALKDYMPGSEIVFDAMTPLLIGLHNLQLATMKVKARLAWGVKDERALEAWGENIRLCEAWYYFDTPEPRLGASNLFRYIPPLGKGVKILHYRLG